MTLEFGLLFGILAIGLVLFSIEIFPMEVVALGILLSLAVTGLLPVDLAFRGFGSDTVITMLGLLILTAALDQTGVTNTIARVLMRSEKLSETRLMALIMGVIGGLSSVMGNTASTALLLPIVVDASRQARISRARLLMPLAFGAILASSTTLISTSTNLVVSGMMTQSGLAPIGMFEMTLVGIPILLIGIGYMLTIGRRLIPDRIPPGEVSEGIRHRLYFTEMIVPPGSPVSGKTLEELDLRRTYDVTVLRIIRGDEHILAPQQSDVVLEGDSLLVQGPRKYLLSTQESLSGLSIKPVYKHYSPDTEMEIELAEVLVMPGSSMIGRTLKGLHFGERFGVHVIGIDHHGRTLLTRLADVRLGAGDVLLVQGSRVSINALSSINTLRVLGRIDPPNQAKDRRLPILLIFAAALLASTFNLVSLPVAMLGGALLAFITRCITPELAYKKIPWQVLIMVGSMLGIGAAMMHTGAAAYLAGHLLSMTQSPFWLLTAFFVMVLALTQPMSNQAAAAVVFPVAMQAAVQLGLNPRTFAMMIAIGASTSFITPLEPACLLIYGPGRYKFFDFVKVGSLLSLAVYVVAIVLVPLLWPL